MARTNEARAAVFIVIAAAAGACGGLTKNDAGSDGGVAASSGATDAGRADGASGFTSLDASSVPPALGPDTKVDACGLVPGAGLTSLSSFPIASIGLYFLAVIDEECTDLGGTHLTWKVAEPCALSEPTPLVHSGGHGCILTPTPVPGDLAIVASLPRPARIPAGLCLDGTPSAPAVARVVVPVSSKREGQDILARFCPRPLGGR